MEICSFQILQKLFGINRIAIKTVSRMSNFLQVLCRFFRGFSPKSDNVLPFSYRLYGWLSEIISEILVGLFRVFQNFFTESL